MLSDRAFLRAALHALRDAAGAESAEAVVTALDADPEAAVHAIRLLARGARQIVDERPELEVRDTLRALLGQLAVLRSRTARRTAA
jgi:hypothetical protein